MLLKSILDLVGNTPLVQLHTSGSETANVYAKMELMNPFGMKDRFAYYGILQAKASGQLKENGIIIESSSGTLAAGLALVGQALNHEVHIVTDPRIDPVTLAKLRALGTTVHIVERMTKNGWQSARLEKLQELLAQYPDAFWPQQYSNPDNPEAYQALAQELLRELGQIDILVGSVGSGGSLCGTATVLKKTFPNLLVVAVDAVNSAIFEQPDRPGRLQSGLGNSLIPPNVNKSVIDQVHWLNDTEAFAATLQLALNEQIFAGNSSGSAYWVAKWLSQKVSPNYKIVVILPDRGDRYFNTFYDPVYHQKHQLNLGNLPQDPQCVSYGTPVQSWSYAYLPSSKQ